MDDEQHWIQRLPSQRLTMSTTGTNEGLAVHRARIYFTVQYHPEACPGPQDTAYLFDRFMDMMKKED